MIVNEFGTTLISSIKTFITGIITFWNDYLNYPLFRVTFNGVEYNITVLFTLSATGLLIILTMKVIDLVIPN